MIISLNRIQENVKNGAVFDVLPNFLVQKAFSLSTDARELHSMSGRNVSVFIDDVRSV